MDSIIQLVLVLFVLSLICERMANFLKLQFSNKRLLLMFKMGNTRDRSKDPAEEKRRELRILKLNLLCGVVTAVAMRADLISLLENATNPSSVIGWGSTTKVTAPWYLQAVGFLLTGLFISLGSKFWHDLLDLLLEVKNTKALLNEKTMKNLSSGDFSSLPSATQDQLIDGALAENFERWRTQFGITGASNSFKLTGGQPTAPAQRALTFQVARKVPPGNVPGTVIPAQIYYGGFAIPTDVIQAGVTKANAGNVSELPCDLGNSIARINNAAVNQITGTMGLKIRSTALNKEYLLSCYHVLFSNELGGSQPRLVVKGPSDIVSDAHVVVPSQLDSNNSTIVGTVCLGTLSDFMDVGLVELDPVQSPNISEDVEGIGAIGFTPTDNDNMINRQVRISGRTTSPGPTGTVVSANSTQLIAYEDFGFTHTLQGLIQISPRISDSGDSGASVVDSNNHVIGIVVGSDDGNSYAMNIMGIVNTLNSLNHKLQLDANNLFS
jgi:hypothetical protein